MHHFRRAFTLIELLVVIGIIALLIGVLLPALISARKVAQATVCASNLRRIGAAVEAYAKENHDYIHRAQNNASWLDTWAPPGEGSALRLIWPNAIAAYWGSAYFPYLTSREISGATGENARNIITVARATFRCPASISMEMDPAGENRDPENPVSYGVNGRLTQGTSVPAFPYVPGGPFPSTTIIWAKLHKRKWPSKTIFAQDAVEMRLEDKAQDSLSGYGKYGPTDNLLYWRSPGLGYAMKPDAINEYFRHRSFCQVVFLDWHVEGISKTDTHVSSLAYEGDNGDKYSGDADYVR